MQHPIYSCIWFNNNAQEAASFYCSIFNNSSTLQKTPIVTTFMLNGTKFMGLNGGPMYQVTPAVSYYVYCGSESEITRLYQVLSENGKILMPLNKYDWSDKYAWISDQYGVNWQLDISDIDSEQKIIPSLLFANDKMTLLKEALTQYTSIFKNNTIVLKSPYPKSSNLPDDTLLFAQFKLNDLIFNGMSSVMKHDFDFTPGNSFVIECDTQQEIDYYWELLGKDGRYDNCGWLADKYGISWQIVPTILPKLMSNPEKGQRVIQAFLKMKKFDIAALENA